MSVCLFVCVRARALAGIHARGGSGQKDCTHVHVRTHNKQRIDRQAAESALEVCALCVFAREIDDCSVRVCVPARARKSACGFVGGYLQEGDKGIAVESDNDRL